MRPGELHHRLPEIAWFMLRETRFSILTAKAPRLVRDLTGAGISYVSPIAIVAAALLVLVGWYGLHGESREVAARALSAPEMQLSAVPPTPEPLVFKPTPPKKAMAINISIPVSGLPNRAANPYLYASKDKDDYARSLRCLTAAIYYEAAIEPPDGQRAVAQVVINRVRHPAYPKSVCGVVFQGSERRTGCQFTFTCDGSLARAPSQQGWKRAQGIAQAALAGSVHQAVGWATHYHTNWVVPYWSSSLTKLANVGSHIFYRWAGPWGTAVAFRSRVSGAEPVIARFELPTASAANEAGLAAKVDAASSAEITDRDGGAPVNEVAKPVVVAPPAAVASIELVPGAQGAGFGAASTSAAARVGTSVGLMAQPDFKRAGCRQISVAAIGSSSATPPPC